MVRSLVLMSAILLALAGGANEARSDVLSGYLQAQSGGAAGVGLVGDLKDDAFHKNSSGLSYGALVGVEIVFIDVWIEHNQFVRGSGLAGTWTQFMSGLDIDFDLGPTKSGTDLGDGRIKGGFSQYYAEFGFGLGFGVGTGQQVDPPLDVSELSDRGFLFQAQIGAGIRLHKLFSVGVSLPMQAAYMLKADAPANELDTNYASMQAALVVNARFKWQIK